MSQIILLNGPSSAGKSTLARAFRDAADEPFLHFSYDVFLDGDILPRQQLRSGRFDWEQLRPQVIRGYYHCLKGLAECGNHLIVDHIIETDEDLRQLVGLLRPFDVFLVGVHCSLAELERRERERRDRPVGDAARDLQTVHSFTAYDFEIDTERLLSDNVAALLAGWHGRMRPSQFERLGERYD